MDTTQLYNLKTDPGKRLLIRIVALDVKIRTLRQKNEQRILQTAFGHTC